RAARGNTYQVQSISPEFAPLPCARLRVALARIFRANPMPWPAATRARPQGVRLKGAPQGFTCSGASTNPSGKDVHHVYGKCVSTTGEFFNWSPVDPKVIP